MALEAIREWGEWVAESEGEDFLTAEEREEIQKKWEEREWQKQRRRDDIQEG